MDRGIYPMRISGGGYDNVTYNWWPYSPYADKWNITCVDREAEVYMASLQRLFTVAPGSFWVVPGSPRKPFNVNSTEDIADLLESYGVVLPRTAPTKRYPQGKRSTAKAVLEAVTRGDTRPGASSTPASEDW